ncbi:MPPV-040 conserved hypothetical protein [Magpiepox virus 2]|nr:conserved hypothetical protein [Magpiepox virus]QZW33316.1 MPPV-040 conserved hypothetical protein [Magpiepox virus 2]
MNKGKYILGYYIDKKITNYNDIFNILSVEGKISMIYVMLFFYITNKDPETIIFLRNLKKNINISDVKIKGVLDTYEILLYSYKNNLSTLEAIVNDYNKGVLCRELCEAVDVINYVCNTTDEFDMLRDNNKTRFVIEIGNSFTRTGRYEFYLILKYTEKYYDVNKDYMMIKLLKRYLKTN